MGEEAQILVSGVTELIIDDHCTCICTRMNVSLHFQVHLAAPCLLRFMFHQAVFGLLTGVCQPCLCTVQHLSRCTLLALGTYGSYGTLPLTFQMCIREPSIIYIKYIYIYINIHLFGENMRKHAKTTSATTFVNCSAPPVGPESCCADLQPSWLLHPR